jgi:hypothetical protein
MRSSVLSQPATGRDAGRVDAGASSVSVSAGERLIQVFD